MEVPTTQIASALMATEAGQSLDATERWSRFRAGESREVWLKHLGGSAVVTSHLHVFCGVTRAFLRREQGSFTPAEARSLELAAFIHDFGEAKVNGFGIGDVPEPHKTKADEKIESHIAKSVIASLDLSQALRDEMITAYNDVVDGANPKLHNAFKALERTEYLLTGLKVFSRIETGSETHVCKCRYMLGCILAYDLPKILKMYAPAFPNSIGYLLRSSRSSIDRAFDFSREAMDSPEESAKFSAAQGAWNSFLSESTPT